MKESEIRQRHAKTCFHNTREGNVNCVMSGCQGDIELTWKNLLTDCSIAWWFGICLEHRLP